MTTATEDPARSVCRVQGRLDAFLAEAGYRAVFPPVLQPVEPFLELSGEEIRRQIFVTQDGGGRELCLRPELTIPVCRAHLESGAAIPVDYVVSGPVFRLAGASGREILQTGIESIGRTDIAAADAGILAAALAGLSHLGVRDLRIRFGDMGLTAAFLGALQIPPATTRRILRRLAQGKPVASLIEAKPDDPNAALLAAIQGQDRAVVQGFVENVLAIAGISRVGGRNAADIAQRFLAKAEASAGGGNGSLETHRELIDAYFAIGGAPEAAFESLSALVARAGIRSEPLSAALELFEERIGFLQAKGIEGERIDVSGRFARNLDYYTGFIFDVLAPGGAVLVGGGRYDGLIAQLGSPEPLPAVGAAFWLERILDAAPAQD